MDPLLAALLGPEAAMAQMAAPVPQQSLVPTGLTMANMPMGPQLEPPMVPTVPSMELGPRPAPPQEAYRSEPMPSMPMMGQSLGEALEPSGVPMPRARPTEAPQASASAAGGGDGLLKALRGVQAPAAPTPQRVGTPNLPALRPIQGGQYLDLLLALNAQQQQAGQGMKLPSTLGQALGGR